MISPRVLFLLLFAVVLVLRLGHQSIVWVEEGYPAAAALARVAAHAAQARGQGGSVGAGVAAVEAALAALCAGGRG